MTGTGMNDCWTQRSAIEFALRRLLESRLQVVDLDAILGVGWDGDLDDLRSDQLAADPRR